MRFRALITVLVALCVGVLTACGEASVSATTAPLTYDQIKGTGLANVCPTLTETSRAYIPIDRSKSYSFKDVCIQPTTFFVKEESTNKRLAPEFVQGKIVTRETSSLDQISGIITSNSDNSLTFAEKDGLDFQPITVKLPGGELVPFLFTIKELVATTQPNMDSISTSTDFEGTFKVPSYRGSVFLDPKGRGVASGYDNAVALPAEADKGDLARANTKRVETLKGKISLQVAKVDNTTGEIAGTFESEQPSDTDLGADEAKEVKVRGVFYGRIEAN